MSDSIAKTGVWIDTSTGAVVEKEPEQGIQIVAPGTPITPDIEKQVEAAKAAAPAPKSKSSKKS